MHHELGKDFEHVRSLSCPLKGTRVPEDATGRTPPMYNAPKTVLLLRSTHENLGPCTVSLRSVHMMTSTLDIRQHIPFSRVKSLCSHLPCMPSYKTPSPSAVPIFYKFLSADRQVRETVCGEPRA
eukprot:1431329-Amphidinium_carterae.1